MVSPLLSDHSLALIGMMGAGKSSVGRKLAARLGWPFCDLDREVEREAGCSISILFDRDGEAAFREREHRALSRLLGGDPLVLATGGGAVIDPRSRALLNQRACAVWLDALPATLARRLAGTQDRPLLRSSDPRAVLEALLHKRRAFYAEAAIRIDTDDLDEDLVVDSILAHLFA